jgi:hypothetical protein
MPDGSIVVQIAADTSGFSTGIAEASKSLSVVGKSASEAGEQLTRGGAAMEEAKLTAGALTGSVEELARGFAKLAAESPAVSDALRAAIPLIALAAAGEIINELVHSYTEYEDAIAKSRSELTGLDITSRDYADSLDLENLKLQDQINKLQGFPTHSRAAEALDEIKIKADAVGKASSNDLEKLTTLLESGTGAFSSILLGAADESAIADQLKPIQRAYELAVLAKDVEAQKNTLLEAQAVIQKAIGDEQAQQTKVVTDAGDAIVVGREPDTKAIQDYNEALGVVQNSLKSLAEVKTHASLEMTLAGAQQNADDAEYVQKQEERQRKLDELTKQAVESLKASISDENEARASGAKLGEESYAAMERQVKEAARAETEATDQVISSIRLQIVQMDAQVAATARAAAAKKSGPGASTFGEIGADKTELAAITAEIDKLKVEMNEVSLAKSKLADLPFVTPEQQSEIKGLANLYDDLLRKLQQLQGQQQTVFDQMGQTEKKVFDAITNDLNRNLIQWIGGTESFGRAMQKVWTNLAETVISSLLKAGEEMIENAMLQKSIQESTKLSDAAATARHTYASASAIPLVGWVIAPVAAAAAFAAVMAFEKGGIVPAAVHEGEMILPAHISHFVQMAAANAGGSGGAGGNVHLHYSPTVHAIDSTNMESALRGHGEAITGMVMDEMRRRNVA